MTKERSGSRWRLRGVGTQSNARPGQLIILESTTYPGTTVEVLGPIFADRGLIPGRDIFLAFSREREDHGNPDYHTTTIPKIHAALEHLATAARSELAVLS